MSTVRKKVLRGAGKAALCIVGVAVAYMVIGMVLSLIPVNGNAVLGGTCIGNSRHTVLALSSSPSVRGDGRCSRP